MDDQGSPSGRSGEAAPGSGGEAGDAAREPRRASRWPLVIGTVVVLALIVAGVSWWWATRNDASTDDAYTDGRAIIVAPKVAGYVVDLAVNDNQRVKAGDLLVRIDPRDYVTARDQAKGALDLAEAQLRSAEIGLDIAKVTLPARLAQAEAERVGAEADADQADRDAKRQRGVDPRATTEESIDAATYKARAARAAVAADQAQVDIAKLIPQNLGQSAADVDRLKAQVEQARAELAEAELNLSYAELRAPQDGWVTRRNVELGSYLQPGQQIMALVVTEVWVTANYKETELTRMRPGQTVAIAVDAYPDLALTGRVDSVQMGSGARFSAFPAENATGNWVKIVQRVPVKIVITGGLDPKRPLPLGLSVTPTVDLTSGPHP